LIRHATFFCLALALTGCDRFNAALMPAPEKINLAFPLTVELTVAKTSLLNALDSNIEAKQSVTDQLAQLMTVRALSCAGTTQIDRFDTPIQVKTKINDMECFKKQDATLTEWVGLKRVAIALRLPALRPLAALPAKAIVPSADNSVTMAAAESANIAVVKGNAGKFTVVDLSGGKPINSFQAPGEAHRFATVSPNGRLMAVPISNRSLTIYDLETASALWSTDKYSDLVAWMPELEALVLNEPSTSKAVLMDMRTGRTEPYLSAERNLTWALTMPGAKNQQLVGSQNTASLIDHQRNADGSFTVSTAKQWRLNGSGGSGASSLKPLLLLNGKFLAFVSNRDLGWLNLETGQQGAWAMSAIGAHGFSKLNESSIIFFQNKRGSYPSAMKLLDVERMTVSTAKELSASEGYPLPFTPRSGFARAVNNAVVIYTAVEAEAGAAQPLDQLIADAELEQQLAKLQAQAAQSNLNNNNAATNAAASAAQAAADAAVAAAAAANGTTPARQALIDQLSKEVRARNAAAAIRDGLPRETVEQFRNGTLPRISGAGANPSAPISPSPQPLLTDVPSNAQVAIVGVYEARTDPPRAAGSHTPGGIRVSVAPGSAPLVLVLTSYEPVRWNVQNTNGRKIAAVLLSGYHESSVVGLDNAKVLKIGSNYAYKLDSPEYERLKKDVARYVASPVKSFQGGYEGQEFTVY
jgi:hypothetical protein